MSKKLITRPKMMRELGLCALVIVGAAGVEHRAGAAPTTTTTEASIISGWSCRDSSGNVQPYWVNGDAQFPDARAVICPVPMEMVLGAAPPQIQEIVVNAKSTGYLSAQVCYAEDNRDVVTCSRWISLASGQAVLDSGHLSTINWSLANGAPGHAFVRLIGNYPTIESIVTYTDKP